MKPDLPNLILAALAPALATGLPAAAQEASPGTPPTIVEGYVVDGSTGFPVPNVLIRFEGGPETISDGDGRYFLDGVGSGVRRVVLVTSRCAVNWAAVTLEAGEIRQVAFQVPTEVETADPEAEERAWRRRASGTVVTAEEIDAMNPPDLLEVIRRVAPGMVSGSAGEAGALPRLRSRTNISGLGLVEPVVVVDGVPVDGARSLSHIAPHEVARLEIDKSAAAGWAYGSSGAGGVIRVFTRQGEEGHWNATPRRCVVPPFPDAGSPAEHQR